MKTKPEPLRQLESQAMSCLDGGYGELGRWQAIDTLLLYKVVIPLEYDA